MAVSPLNSSLPPPNNICVKNNTMGSSLNEAPMTDDLPQELRSVTILHLLSNPVILYQTVPYLPISSLFALGATSKSFRNLIHNTQGVFRYANLSHVKSAQSEIPAIDHGGEVWRHEQMDENLTEDEFYGGPLRGIFNNLRQRHILQDVRTLILDGLAVPSDLVSEIIIHESFHVQLLSIREVQHLNERKLMQALVYAVRPSRPKYTPKLQGLYIFGPRDVAPVSRLRRHVNKFAPGVSANHTIPSRGAHIGAEWNEKSEQALVEDIFGNGDKWYQKSGKVIKPPSKEWANTILVCRGIISFDAVLCNGPRHAASTTVSVSDGESSITAWYKTPAAYLPPAVATIALRGCSSCGTSPEGYSRFGSSSMDEFPLLAPPPLHSSTIRSAKKPHNSNPESTMCLQVRCADCLRDRYCESCQKWWCEDCYKITADGRDFTPFGLPQPWEAVGAIFEGMQFEKMQESENVKVHMGLCVEYCLVAEMMSGAGNTGMWG